MHESWQDAKIGYMRHQLSRPFRSQLFHAMSCSRFTKNSEVVTFPQYIIRSSGSDILVVARHLRPSFFSSADFSPLVTTSFARSVGEGSPPSFLYLRSVKTGFSFLAWASGFKPEADRFWEDEIATETYLVETGCRHAKLYLARPT